MAYYFKNPLDANETFERLKGIIANVPDYYGRLTLSTSEAGYSRGDHTLFSGDRDSDLSLLRQLNTSGRHWLIYDRKRVAEDYQATMMDAGLGYAGVDVLICDVFLAEGKINEETENFDVLFLVGCESAADVEKFKANCENRDLVV
ncbi:hypothetical protein [Agrobacterium sp. CG674]